MRNCKRKPIKRFVSGVNRRTIVPFRLKSPMINSPSVSRCLPNFNVPNRWSATGTFINLWDYEVACRNNGVALFADVPERNGCCAVWQVVYGDWCSYISWEGFCVNFIKDATPTRKIKVNNASRRKTLRLRAWLNESPAVATLLAYKFGKGWKVVLWQNV